MILGTAAFPRFNMRQECWQTAAKPETIQVISCRAKRPDIKPKKTHHQFVSASLKRNTHDFCLKKRRKKCNGTSNVKRSRSSLYIWFQINTRILPFVAQHRPSVPTLKQILTHNWHLIHQQPLLSRIFKDPPIVSFKRGRSLKDTLARAKL